MNLITKSFLFFLLIITSNIQAQNKSPYFKRILDKKQQVSLVTFHENNRYSSSNPKTLLRKELKLSPKDDYKLISAKTDRIGFTHEKFQQYYDGVKVEHGIYIVHSKNGEIHAINGQFHQIPGISTSPLISKESALNLALREVNAEQYAWEIHQPVLNQHHKKPLGEIIIIPIQNKEEVTYHLVYKFDIYATIPFSNSSIYIDANSGKSLLNISKIGNCSQAKNPQKKEPIIFPSSHKHDCKTHSLTTGSADTRYSGTRTIETDFFNGSYRLHDYTRASGGIITKDLNGGTFQSIDIYDNDNNWTAEEYDNTGKDNAILDAHWGAGMFYDYFWNSHGRDSYDDQGGAIYIYVKGSGVFAQATNFGVHLFGHGGGNFDPLTTVDIVAHEIGHSINRASALLGPSREPGALREGFSDIWAASVENFADPNKDKWQLGEQYYPNPFSLRSLSNPKLRSDPDTYQGEHWIYPETDCSGISMNDNCGVHTNCGVINHWFYLLSEGSSETDQINDNGDIFQVNGIGIDKAAQIAYRLLTVYLTSNSQFIDARHLGIQAAEDLYGISSPEAIATQNAFYAVGLGNEYSPDCGEVNIFATNNSISISNITAPIASIKVYDPDYSLAFECSNNCGTSLGIPNLSPGDYSIVMQMFTASWQTICSDNKFITVSENNDPCQNLNGDSDNDGTCDDLDCAPNDASLPTNPNTACDDNNSNTSNDIIQADGCTCQGTPDNNDCSTLLINSNDDQISISGIDSPISIIQVFNPDWSIAFNCSANCNNTEVVNNLVEGTYYVKVRLYTAAWQSICEIEEYVTVSNNSCTDADNDDICQTEDCDDSNPELPATPGTTCNDNNENTINDLILSDGCSCQGTLIGGTPCENLLSISTAGNNITVSGLGSGFISKLQIFNDSWSQVDQCFNDCPPTNTTSELSNGRYFVRASLYNNSWGELCKLEQYITVEDDGGTGGGDPCDSLGVTVVDGIVSISDISDAVISKVQIFNAGWSSVYSCFGLGDCSPPAAFSLPEGEYHVSVGRFTADWLLDCKDLLDLTVVNGNGSALEGSGQQDVLFLQANKDGRTTRLDLVSNLDYNAISYELERSPDGMAFTKLGSRVSLFKDANNHHYLFNDEQPLSGDNFYRVKVFLEEGGYLYSEVRSVYFDIDFNGIQVFPNPATDQISLVFNNAVDLRQAFHVYNVHGVLMLNKEVVLVPGLNKIVFSIADFPAGVYFVVSVASGARKGRVRFIKVSR